MLRHGGLAAPPEADLQINPPHADGLTARHFLEYPRRMHNDMSRTFSTSALLSSSSIISFSFRVVGPFFFAGWLRLPGV